MIDSKTVTGLEPKAEHFQQTGVRFARITIKEVRTGTPSVIIGLAEVRFYN